MKKATRSKIKYYDIFRLERYCRRLGIHAQREPLHDGWALRFGNGADCVLHYWCYTPNLKSNKRLIEFAGISDKIDYCGLSYKDAKAIVRVFADYLRDLCDKKEKECA